MTINRREFLLSSASLAVMASRLNAMAHEQAQTESSGGEWPGSGKPSPLVNYNCATLIGLGDEPPAFLDQFGQPGGRRTQVLLDLDYPVKPFQNDAITPDRDWAQWLESGYLPIVRTRGERQRRFHRLDCLHISICRRKGGLRCSQQCGRAASPAPGVSVCLFGQGGRRQDCKRRQDLGNHPCRKSPQGHHRPVQHALAGFVVQ